MPKEQTSSKVSSIAAKYIDLDGKGLVALLLPNFTKVQCLNRVSINPTYEVIAKDIRTLAASCLTQDETPENKEVEL